MKDVKLWTSYTLRKPYSKIMIGEEMKANLKKKERLKQKLQYERRISK